MEAKPEKDALQGPSSESWEALLTVHSSGFRRVLVMCVPETVLKLKERGFHYYSQGENHGDCQIMGWFHRNKLYYVHKLNNASNAADRALAQTSANVVFFDTHRADFKPAFKPGAGLFAAWNPGCLCQRQPMYANTRPTNWTHGYLVRHIIPASGNFTMANILIEDGVSLGGALMGRGER